MPYTNVIAGKSANPKVGESNESVKDVINRVGATPIVDPLQETMEGSGLTQGQQGNLQAALDGIKLSPDAKATRADALDVINVVDSNPVNDEGVGQGAYTGANVQHLSDMDRVNQGAMQQSVVTPLRDAIELGDRAEAVKIAGDEATLNLHEDYTNKVQNQMGFLATGVGSGSVNKYVNRTAEELRGDPQSVGEFMRTWLTDYKGFEANGVPKAWTDSSLYAVLVGLLEKSKRAQKDSNTLLENEEDLVAASVATNEEIGGLIEGAFNVKNGSPATRSIGGGLALRVVTDALGTVDYASGEIQNVENANNLHEPLFHTKAVDVTTQDGQKKTVYQTELTEAGMDAALALKELGDRIFPSAKKDVNPHPPLDVNTAEETSLSKLLQRKEDKNRKAGPAIATNKGAHALDQSAHAISFDPKGGISTVSYISESMQNPDVMAIMEGPGFLNIQGLEVGNQVYKTDANGQRFRRRYKVSNLIDGKPNPYPGGKIPNPNAHLENELEWVTEPFDGDWVKQMAFDETVQWIADHVGDHSFFYTHFIGGAKRVHVDQTLGNYQSSKLARGVLEAAVKERYELGTNEEVELKAGILKKFGMNKAKHGSNQQLANNFASTVAAWRNIQDAHTNAGGKGLAPDLWKQAKEEEGFSSISAIAEAFKLADAIKQGVSEYKSGFITEIDGTANGIAINTMFAGNEMVKGKPIASLVGMKGVDVDNDVYSLTSDMFMASAKKYGGKVKNFSNTWNELKPLIHSINEHRGLAKKPLLTFGYGAGDYAIKQGFIGELRSLLDENFELKQKIEDSLDNDSKAFEAFLDASGDVMNASVNQNFPGLKSLANTLSNIVEFSIDQGVAPRTITNNADFIEFGLSRRVVNEDKSFKGSYGKGATENQQSRGINLQSMLKVNDPAGKDSSGQAARYKGAKQAPVLITQSIDALVMMRALSRLKEKLGRGFYAAQIFDGVMMTPKKARMFSEQLHKELIYIGNNYDMVGSLMEEIFKLDPAKFMELAKINNPKQGPQLIKNYKNSVKAIMKLALSGAKPVYVKGEKISLVKMIEGLERRSKAYMKTLNLKDMYQYGWDFPAKK